LKEGRPLTLDGQWEFYPQVWLESKKASRSIHADKPAFVNVPGNWNAHLTSGENTPYGYGSYRLRILVDPDVNLTYGIRVPSVRSSSELYVNGRMLAGSGQPSSDEEHHKARNVPFSASFSADGDGVIEVVVQAANYKDPRASGIVRSIKFGTEQSIARDTQLSMAMQQLVAVVFLIHGVYAVILYLVGNRERSLLYFALLTVSAVFMYLLGTEEKLLHEWFSVDYEWGFKLVHFAMVGIAFSMLQCVKRQLPQFGRRVYPGWVFLCGISGALALILPAHIIISIQGVYALLVIIAIFVTIVSLLRTSLKEIRESRLLMLSLFAFANNFLWWGVLLATGIKVPYYPFDMIVATTCFASVWFRRYFQVHHEAQKLAAELQRKDKVKDQFLANTSHELRNPLHGILNLSQAVLEREKQALNKNSVKDLETVLAVGRRMSLMLSELLDAISMKENEPRMQLRNVSVQALASGVLDTLFHMSKGKQIRLASRIPENFPQVVADENRLVQILFNLLHNAVKFTNEGEVSIRGELRNGRAFLTVADTGIGMDEETRKRVFDAYEQAHPEITMVEGGFGLGLSVSKQLVELHGSKLEVRSVPGEGSEFEFSLPIADSSFWPEEGAEAAASLAALEAAAALSADPRDMDSTMPQKALEDRPRILLVDDDPINLNVIENILTHERYEIIGVSSGKKALAKLDEKEWDLVIADVMMPLMSGYELTRVIRERFTVTELPILLLTARSRSEDIENGFLSGANDYVTKPVDALELRSRVQALTGVRISARERLRMEAAWLQAQIQPHFIFNTLSALAALSDYDTERMRALIEVFGNFLRGKFQFKNIDALVPMEEELDLVRSYLYVEKERFGERLHVDWEIDDCRKLAIPPLTIQPLVENAILHGIMQRAKGGRLRIRISDRGSYAEISVEDDGVGMDEDTVRHVLERKSDGESGIGLLNTDLRLKRHFGEGLRIESRPYLGTLVMFKVKKENHTKP